jgi:ferrous iron transport protein A
MNCSFRPKASPKFARCAAARQEPMQTVTKPCAAMAENLFPLSEAKVGARLKIEMLDAGKGLNERLARLGLYLQSDMEVLQLRLGGAMVVARGDTRIALGAGMTAKIMVSEIPATDSP